VGRIFGDHRLAREAPCKKRTEVSYFPGFIRKEKKEVISMKSVESFCKKAIEMGIEGAKIIKPGSIVTAEWVRMKCQ